MIAAERRVAILTMIRSNGVVSLRDLSAAVRTSDVTVRRDLRALEEQGLIDRRHGGAVLPGGLSHEQSYRQKSRVAAPEKAAMAELAVDLIHEGDAIVVGAGSTTHALARLLGRFHDLTVVTNSLLVAQDLASTQVEVVVTGGSLRGSTYALVGPGAEQGLAAMRLRWAFLSGNGLTPDRGLSTPNMLAASVDRAIADAAAEVVVLADHTKLGVDTMCLTVSSDQVDHLITDWQADNDMLKRFRDCEVNVHVAPDPGAPNADSRAELFGRPLSSLTAM